MIPRLTASLFQSLEEKAARLGFDHVAVAPARIDARDQNAYADWIGKGYAADMAYLVREPEKRVTPSSAFPDARSVITFAVSYFQEALPPKPGRAYGRVARYAWGLDYHTVITERLSLLTAEIDSAFGSQVVVAPATDSKPVLERALARQSGLGFIGKNTVLIVPRQPANSRFHVGSWVFLAEIFLKAELAFDPPKGPELGGCGGCTKCLDACPTNAFEAPYLLRSDRCIAYWTIENKGIIPAEFRARMGDWIFGCDVCQDVCPFNARARKSLWPEFEPANGTGAWVALADILRVRDNAQFKARWGETPLSRPKRRGLIRNACVAAANAAADELVPDLEELLNDPEPVIRAHAVWSLSRLTGRARLHDLANRVRSHETDAAVRGEWETVLA